MGRAELSVHLPPLPYALALAPTAESSPAPENFFAKTPSTERLLPFWGRNRFWTGFCQRGHSSANQRNDIAVSKRRGRCLSALTKRIKSLKTALHQELG